jgi:hypothetical protein
MKLSRPTPARSYPALPKVVVGVNDAIFVLNDADFDLTPHVTFTEDLSERLKLDLSVTLAVMKRLPLWQSGDNHVSLRREVAAFLAEERKDKNSVASRRIRLALNSYMQGSDINLLAAIRDVVHIFMEEVTGLPLIDCVDEDMPSIFSSNLGIRARKQLESSLRAQSEFARERFPDETECRRLLRVGQWTMGRDALIGTLGLSLYHHLVLLDGRPLNSIRLPELPTHTGIPTIGRIARKDRFVAGCPVSSGDLIECRLDTAATQPENVRRHFFGVGTHLCLGRPLTLNFMSMVADALFEFNFGLKTRTFDLAENDVFDIPAVFKATRISNQLAEDGQCASETL